MDADFDEIRGKARLGRGDAKIRDQREPEAAADRWSLNRRDHRLLAAKEPHRFEIKRVAALWRLALIERVVLRTALKVRAGAKRLAFGGEQDAAAAGVLIEGLEGVRDVADQGVVEKVVRRPMNLDGRYIVVADLDAHITILVHRFTGARKNCPS